MSLNSHHINVFYVFCIAANFICRSNMINFYSLHASSLCSLIQNRLFIMPCFFSMMNFLITTISSLPGMATVSTFLLFLLSAIWRHGSLFLASQNTNAYKSWSSLALQIEIRILARAPQMFELKDKAMYFVHFQIVFHVWNNTFKHIVVYLFVQLVYQWVKFHNWTPDIKARYPNLIDLFLSTTKYMSVCCWFATSCASGFLPIL